MDDTPMHKLTVSLVYLLFLPCIQTCHPVVGTGISGGGGGGREGEDDSRWEGGRGRRGGSGEGEGLRMVMKTIAREMTALNGINDTLLPIIHTHPPNHPLTHSLTHSLTLNSSTACSTAKRGFCVFGMYLCAGGWVVGMARFLLQFIFE